MSLVVEQFSEPGDVKTEHESLEQRLRKNFLALQLEKKAIIRKFLETYKASEPQQSYRSPNRCERCGHEFPHHWSGCGEVRHIRY